MLTTKEDLRKNAIPEWSNRIENALKFADLPSLMGNGDIGRLMQIQSFYIKSGFGFSQSNREYRSLRTWMAHYREQDIPFITARTGEKLIHTYKYREVIDQPANKKLYHEKKQN